MIMIMFITLADSLLRIHNRNLALSNLKNSVNPEIFVDCDYR